MSKKLISSIIILTIFIIVSIWAYISSANLTKEIQQVSNSPETSHDKANVEELVITETKNGEKFWEAYATSGKYENSRSIAKLIDVKGNFYKNNKVVLSFEAPYAEFNDKIKEIKLTGGSRAATEDQIVISSQELMWSGARDEIQATGNVKISKFNKFVTTGNKSIFNTDLTRFKMVGNSKTNVYTKN